MVEKRVSKSGKVLATILLLPLAIIVPILSLESHYAAPTQAQTQTDSAMTTRITAYKAVLGREVLPAEQQRIVLRCAVTQANAKTLAKRLESVEKNRNTAYDKILKDLNTLATDLDKQAFETTTLKTNIATLQNQVDSFKTNMNNYHLAVSDLANMDCAGDPIGFISALQAARKAHQAVIPNISEIRSTITNTIKPNLEQIRGQVEIGQTTGGSQ